MKTFRDFIAECELVEGYQPLPAKKMLWKIKMKSKAAQNAMDFRRDNRHYSKGEMGERLKNMTKGKIEKISPQIKKMKTKIRNHDPIESRFKELENRDRGEKKSKTKLKKDYELSSDGKYRKRSGVKEEVDIYDIEEGKVEWDNPRRPLQSGLTPREKNRAKRVSTNVENPDRVSFGGKSWDVSDKDYERYGKLKIAHDEQKGKKVPSDKIHKFNKLKWPDDTSLTRGQVIRKRKDQKNIKTKMNSKLYKNDERQKVYHHNDLKEPKD